MRPSLIIMLCLLFLPISGRAAPLDSVQTFAYQLQSISPTELAASPYDLIVMDYSSDGTSSTEFAREAINQIISGRQGRKVISYFSIGEAEDYRFYFRKAWIQRGGKRPCRVKVINRAPTWLDAPNPNFCNNYKTRYWERSWKRILFGVRSGARKSYLDRIIDAGFHGIYLDIIDGYEYWKYEKRRPDRRKTAARDMAQLVIEIANYARVSRGIPEFIVVPQNGSGILGEISESLKSRYLSAIDAIGAEDTFYFGDKDEDNSLTPQEPIISDLKEFQSSGKKVFAIDYLTDPLKIADFKTQACEAGFIPQVSVRALDTISGHKLDGCS